MMHQLHKHDAEYRELVRLLSLYDAFTLSQAERFFPNLPVEKCHLLLKRLQKQGRAYLHNRIITRQADFLPSQGQLAAFWVMLDFLPKITYHIPGSFPIQIAFFIGNESYEIIHVPEEKEAVIAHALTTLPLEENQKRILIVDNKQQITRLSLSDVTAYCMVTPDGTVTYFNLQGA